MNPMEKPKSLPWLARKAGVSDQLVETLWNRALALAGASAQGAESQRMAEAMQHLLKMLERTGMCRGFTPRHAAGS
jgi:hypothetical protein